MNETLYLNQSGTLSMKSLTNNVNAKQKEEDRILKGIEDLIDYNNKITQEVNILANSEFKMLFMVATYRTEEIDTEGKLHILNRKKRGFMFEGNDYYTLDYSNTKPTPRIYRKKSLQNTYPGADYLVKDLQALKRQFMISYNVDE